MKLPNTRALAPRDPTGQLSVEWCQVNLLSVTHEGILCCVCAVCCRVLVMMMFLEDCLDRDYFFAIGLVYLERPDNAKEDFDAEVTGNIHGSIVGE